jgi:hypothetical protein
VPSDGGQAVLHAVIAGSETCLEEEIVMRASNVIFSCALVLLSAGAATRAQTVWTVDITGNGDFTWFFQAVDAAASGDTIIIKSSDTDSLFDTPTDIDGKVLTVVGDSPAPTLVGPVLVRNQPAGTTTVLRHLDVKSLAFSPLSGTTSLTLLDNAGTVWCEDLVGSGGAAPTLALSGGLGARVQNSPSVVMLGCKLTGGAGHTADPPFSPAASPGGQGLLATNSHVNAVACEFRGGAGGNGTTSAGGKGGGHGVESIGSTILLSGSLVAGGSSNTSCGTCPADGLHADAASSVPWLSTTFQAGFNFVFPPGSPIDAPAGVAMDLADASRTLTISAPLREGQAGTIAYKGEQGDSVGVFVTLDTSWVLLTAKKGVYDLGFTPVGPLSLGTVTDPGGSLALPFTAPALPGAMTALTVYLQAIAVESGGGARLSGPSAFVVLDSSL